MKLHNYFRSSTSTRVRVALNLKELNYHYHGYSLLEKAHKASDFLDRSSAGLVPVLELDDGRHLTQSLAIIEYLEEVYPDPPLLPNDPFGRARVRAMAQMIACEVHPLNNLRVLQRLEHDFSQDAAGKTRWFRHWVAETFAPLEDMLAKDAPSGIYCHGNTPGLADICLFAQVLNNRRFSVDMTPYPVINRIYEALELVPAFANAAPDQQPDAP